MPRPIRLSIIIAHYNQPETLPQTLDSVLAQNLEDFEVVIVDDCSDKSCAALVGEYRQKGLKINLIINEARLFTKTARLRGVEAAQGDIITFIDADDWFYGEKTLPALVDLMWQKKVDILHFEVREFDGNMKEQPRHYWPQPYSQELYGQDVFDFYCQQHRMQGHTIWGKLYSKGLLLKCLPIAKSIKVHRFQEDFFLYTVFAFHAQSYLAAYVPAYAYRSHPGVTLRDQGKGLGRAVTMFQMERHLIPYFQEHGCSEDSLGAMRGNLKFFLKFNLDAYCGLIQSRGDRAIGGDEFDKLMEVMPAEQYLEVLLLNYPVKQERGNLEMLDLYNEQLRRAKELQNKYNALLRRTAPYRKFIKLCKSPLLFFKDARKGK